MVTHGYARFIRPAAGLLDVVAISVAFAILYHAARLLPTTVAGLFHQRFAWRAHADGRA